MSTLTYPENSYYFFRFLYFFLKYIYDIVRTHNKHVINNYKNNIFFLSLLTNVGFIIIH